MPQKQQTENLKTLTRPATPPRTPEKSVQSHPRLFSSPSPQKSKPAWVVADWKHRVPEQGLPGPRPSPGSLNGSARSQLVLDAKRQLAADYACLHQTIDAILSRCSKVQQRLGSGRCHTASRPHRPTWLSARSSLLFAAPAAATQQHQQQSQGHAVAGAAATTGAGLQCVKQAQEQRLPQQPWCGAIDLNPGFAFTPAGLTAGSIERQAGASLNQRRSTAATAPAAASCQAEAAALQELLSQFGRMSGELQQLDLAQLSHREVLQAGLQKLNDQVYGTLRAAAAATTK